VSAPGYDAVVFDMDGVLVERSPSWVFDEAARAAFTTFGAEASEAEYEAVRSLSVLDDGVAEDIAERHGLQFGSIWAAREGLAAINQVRAVETGEKTPYDGASVLADLDLPAGVVSNNSQTAVEILLRRFGFDEHLDTWYGLQPTVEDARNSKPATTYLDRALADLGADHALYVGDRATDVQAARNAGIDGAFVHREFNDEEEFDTPPAHEFEELHELLDVLDGRGAD